MKRRNDIVRIVNELATEYNFRHWDFYVSLCYDSIFDIVKETKTTKHEYRTDNGVLVVDGKYIERVAAFVR